MNGFESKIEELKNETESAEFDLTILRQSGSDLEEATESLRKLLAIGVKTKDIIDLTKILDKEIANNDSDSNSNEKIDYETLLSRLEKYRNLESVIENLGIDKDELMG